MIHFLPYTLYLIILEGGTSHGVLVVVLGVGVIVIAELGKGLGADEVHRLALPQLLGEVDPGDERVCATGASGVPDLLGHRQGHSGEGATGVDLCERIGR